MDAAERLPPHDREAERTTLSWMMRDAAALAEVLGLLVANDFYVGAHKDIFTAIAELADVGQAIDMTAVSNRLEGMRRLDDAGGRGYIAEVYVDAASSENVRACAARVKAKAVAYRLTHASRAIDGIAHDSSLSAAEKVEQAERLILDISESSGGAETFHVADVVLEAWAAIDERRARMENAFKGVPTGFAELDVMTTGLQRGELYIVAARPSVGKTAIAVGIARHVAIEEQVPILFVSLEQNRRELIERLLCNHAQVDGQRLRTGRPRPAESDRLLQAGELVSKSRLFIADVPNQTMTTIAANARRMKRLYGIELLVIDYLQLVSADAKRETRQEQIANISRRLKLLARELAIPVLVLAQLNREVEARQGQRPKLSDLRESGALEQDADGVFLLHRHDDTLIDLIVAKQRNGPTGDVRLLFIKQQMRFESFETTAAQ